MTGLSTSEDLNKVSAQYRRLKKEYIKVELLSAPPSTVDLSSYQSKVASATGLLQNYRARGYTTEALDDLLFASRMNNMVSDLGYNERTAYMGDSPDWRLPETLTARESMNSGRVSEPRRRPRSSLSNGLDMPGYRPQSLLETSSTRPASPTPSMLQSLLEASSTRPASPFSAGTQGRITYEGQKALRPTALSPQPLSPALSTPPQTKPSSPEGPPVSTRTRRRFSMADVPKVEQLLQKLDGVVLDNDLASATLHFPTKTTSTARGGRDASPFGGEGPPEGGTWNKRPLSSCSILSTAKGSGSSAAKAEKGKAGVMIVKESDFTPTIKVLPVYLRKNWGSALPKGVLSEGPSEKTGGMMSRNMLKGDDIMKAKG